MKVVEKAGKSMVARKEQKQVEVCCQRKNSQRRNAHGGESNVERVLERSVEGGYLERREDGQGIYETEEVRNQRRTTPLADRCVLFGREDEKCRPCGWDDFLCYVFHFCLFLSTRRGTVLVLVGACRR